MNRAREYFSKDFLSVYSRKALTLFPLTFLLTPLFYAMLGYHPEIPLFKLLVYLWYALFIYLGMTLTLLLNKYKNLAYPVLALIAFLCKNIWELPVFGIKRNMFLFTDIMTTISREMTADELQDLAMIVFVTSFLMGCFGAVYSKKTALEFVKKGNTFLFIHLNLFSAVFYIVSGIEEYDKNATAMFIFYTVCFAVAYFLVKNFTQLNRQLEVYAERGAYNISGTKRIYGYYLSSLAPLSVIPFIICFIIAPFVVNLIWNTVRTIIGGISYLFGINVPLAQRDTEDLIINNDPYSDSSAIPQSYELEVYNILLIIFLTIVLIAVIIFRKRIKNAVLAMIEYLKTRFKLDSEHGAFIISHETITEIEKEKKKKASYKDYIKKSKGIADLRKRFLFLYNYLFWNIIRTDKDLKENATPNEVAEKYKDTQSPAELYQDIKYGQKSEENSEILTNMTEKMEDILKKM